MCGCDILQWNCKGLSIRAEDLKVLLRDCNPGVICLQETKLGPVVFNPMLNYNIFSQLLLLVTVRMGELLLLFISLYNILHCLLLLIYRLLL